MLSTLTKSLPVLKGSKLKKKTFSFSAANSQNFLKLVDNSAYYEFLRVFFSKITLKETYSFRSKFYLNQNNETLFYSLF